MDRMFEKEDVHEFVISFIGLGAFFLGFICIMFALMIMGGLQP